MLSIIVGPVLAFLAHAGFFAWYADRTPARQTALRPLAPLVAVTSIVGAVAVGFIVAPSLHRNVAGTVITRFDLPMKTGRATYLRIEEAGGATLDVAVPRAFWERCIEGDAYSRAPMSPVLRCGTRDSVESLMHVWYALMLWGALAVALLAATHLRLRHLTPDTRSPATRTA
jgi:hypothetical protein